MSAVTTRNYQILYGSLEYLPVRVSATVDGVDYDPTDDAVEIALPISGTDPISGDWKSADWQTIDDDYFARVLVGPGGDFDLSRGDYDILVRIHDSPEVPILKAGLLTIV